MTLKNETLLEVLMRRDEMTKEEALSLIEEAKHQLQEYLLEENIESRLIILGYAWRMAQTGGF